MSPSPTTPPEAPASPSTLAGPAGQPAPPSTGDSGGGDDGLKMVIERIRGMETDLIDIAHQFPTVGPAGQKAVEAIRSVLRQIIANPGTPEPATPNIGG